MASIMGYTKAKFDSMVALLAPLISPTFTGNPTAPTAAVGDNDTSIATTAFVATSLVSLASLASPTFTGDPKAPTAVVGDNDTSIATTAFVATSFAPLASPTFTGDPKVPTAIYGDSDTSIATTAFVQNEKLRSITSLVGTAYTLVLTDKDKVLESANAAVQTITIPPNSTTAFPIGTMIQLVWAGVGKPSIAAGAGVTIVSPGGFLGCRIAWSTITFRKRLADTWILSGDVG